MRNKLRCDGKQQKRKMMISPQVKLLLSSLEDALNLIKYDRSFNILLFGFKNRLCHLSAVNSHLERLLEKLRKEISEKFFG